MILIFKKTILLKCSAKAKSAKALRKVKWVEEVITALNKIYESGHQNHILQTLYTILYEASKITDKKLQIHICHNGILLDKVSHFITEKMDSSEEAFRFFGADNKQLGRLLLNPRPPIFINNHVTEIKANGLFRSGNNCALQFQIEGLKLHCKSFTEGVIESYIKDDYTIIFYNVWQDIQSLLKTP